MHELGIAAEALQQTLDHAARAGASRVSRIVLRVGLFSGVDPEALRFAFSAVLPGTPAEGAEVEITTIAAVGHCPDCGKDFSPAADLLFECPECGRISTTIVQGRELELSRLEVF